MQKNAFEILQNFKFEIIEECKVEELSSREKYWINYYKTYSANGYNATAGGEDNKK